MYSSFISTKTAVSYGGMGTRLLSVMVGMTFLKIEKIVSHSHDSLHNSGGMAH